mmetsp:Transcript_25606/g.37835  ORF Transcript_25606/g.37835 Transcript_25606/m.37835 type:complete len:495 (-) Transcript_25606:4705-6189(-)
MCPQPEQYERFLSALEAAFKKDLYEDDRESVQYILDNGSDSRKLIKILRDVTARIFNITNLNDLMSHLHSLQIAELWIENKSAAITEEINRAKNTLEDRDPSGLSVQEEIVVNFPIPVGGLSTLFLLQVGTYMGYIGNKPRSESYSYCGILYNMRLFCARIISIDHEGGPTYQSNDLCSSSPGMPSHQLTEWNASKGYAQKVKLLWLQKCAELCEEGTHVSKTHFCDEPCEEALLRYNDHRYKWGSDEEYPFLPANFVESIKHSARETWFESIRSLTIQPINELLEVYSTKPEHPPGDDPYNDWIRGDKYKINKWRAYYAWIINTSKTTTTIRRRGRGKRMRSSSPEENSDDGDKDMSHERSSEIESPDVFTRVFNDSSVSNELIQKRMKIEDGRYEETTHVLRDIGQSIRGMTTEISASLNNMSVAITDMAQSIRSLQVQRFSTPPYICGETRMRYSNSSPMPSNNEHNSALSPVVMSLDDSKETRFPRLENK